MESTASIAPPHVGLIDRTRVALACGVAILMMYGVGWNVAQPPDPLLGLTLTAAGRSSYFHIWMMMLVLGAVTSAIATAVAGKRLPEAGLFATGVGMATMALRGGSMQSVLAYCASPETASRRELMWLMGQDCLLWAAVMALAWAASTLTRKWLWPDSKVSASPARTKPVSPQLGAATLASTLIVALMVIWLTIARTPVAEIARGQVVASVAAGLFLGAMAGRTVTGVDNVRWYLPAVVLVGLTAYLIGYLESDMSWAASGSYRPYAALATTPPHDLVRPLPIEYMTVGVAAVLGGFWCGDKVEQTVEEGAR